MQPVFMEVDGTLLDSCGVESAFIDYLAARKILTLKHALQRLAFAVRWSPTYGRDVFRMNKVYLAGLRRADVDAFASCFVSTRLVPTLRPAILERIDAHRDRGDVVVLLAEAPEFLLRALARHLGIRHWRGTDCAYLGNLYLFAPPLFVPHGTAKLKAANEMCETLGRRWGIRFTLRDCVAYAHSRTDLPLLSAVGTPIAVHPDDRLEREARVRGWQVIST
jgi:phosphoserine phosphatase